ncbi:hypothetical protein HYPSUDRAFT_117665, partial [Hypholoma sublateritium FD-334 SS-4]
PPIDSPEYIIAFIINECDELTLDGKVKPQGAALGTYSHAQKIRAAMTHAFGRVHSLGNTSWHKDEITGCMRGNPSVSQQVSSYMLSLRNRKTRSGEMPTSARAITSDVLRKLHDFNLREENWKLRKYAP